MLSLLTISRRVDDKLVKTIKSVETLEPQMVVGISESDDELLGKRKNALIAVAAGEWLLLLDTDEVVSVQLAKEIHDVVTKSPDDTHGYQISYQNHAFGKELRFGGEKYAKVRLFRKKYGYVSPLPVHEEVIVEGKLGKLTGVIHHYSYQTLSQVLVKFTSYAWTLAGQKRQAKERNSFQKLFLYGPHMFWARAIKDQGWRDGWRGILLALCFGYMETLTYWLLLYRAILHV